MNIFDLMNHPFSKNERLKLLKVDGHLSNSKVMMTDRLKWAVLQLELKILQSFQKLNGHFCQEEIIPKMAFSSKVGGQNDHFTSLDDQFSKNENLE